MTRFPTHALALVLASAALAACTTGRGASTRAEAPGIEAPQSARPSIYSPTGPGTLSRSAEVGAAAVGRWIAVDVVGDAEATRDLRRGLLEKTLVVNPGGHVILRGVDRAPGGGAASFSGTVAGRVVTFADLPGAALLSLEGTRLLLTDPAGRTTRFVREAE